MNPYQCPPDHWCSVSVVPTVAVVVAILILVALIVVMVIVAWRIDR